MMKRDFLLPEEDTEYLDASEFDYETIDNGGLYLVIHGYPVPAGYNHDKVSLALKIPPSYPSAQIDMVFFNPSLQRLDGKPINALITQQFIGQTWQRWSRHRTGADPWRPGIDCVATHLSLVDDWLLREFKLR